MQIGDIIKYRKWVWRVLDKTELKALLITEEIVELRAYHDKSGDVTWADCALRRYDVRGGVRPALWINL